MENNLEIVIVCGVGPMQDEWHSQYQKISHMLL